MSQPGSGVRVAAVALLLLGVVACGSDDPDPTAADPSATSSEPTEPTEPTEPSETVPADAPECAELWVEDGELPRGYDGCVDPAGAYVPSDKLSCSSGQVMVTFDDTYFAVVGGTIRQASAPLAEDRDYRAAVRSCRA